MIFPTIKLHFTLLNIILMNAYSNSLHLVFRNHFKIFYKELFLITIMVSYIAIVQEKKHSWAST